jgi:hypothetical protein
MVRWILAVAVAMMLAAATAPAGADIISPDSSYVVVTFGPPYKTASSHDRITICPDGDGETFASKGILIEVFVKNSSGAKMVGVPAAEVVLFNSALCICVNGNIADADTDQDGRTTFTGTIEGGGCVESLDVYASGLYIATTDIKTNSPDAMPATPCYVDAADLSGLAARLGVPANYSICFDYNESGGPTINAADLSAFAAHLGHACN